MMIIDCQDDANRINARCQRIRIVIVNFIAFSIIQCHKSSLESLNFTNSISLDGIHPLVPKHFLLLKFLIGGPYLLFMKRLYFSLDRITPHFGLRRRYCILVYHSSFKGRSVLLILNAVYRRCTFYLSITACRRNVTRNPYFNQSL